MMMSTAAFADGVDADVLQRILGKEGKNHVNVKALKNDDALRLTMNRDQIIRLNQDAASVVVNNPAHAEVMLDSPRLLIVMPRAPGATSFTVLNSAGDIILRRDIIVTNTQPKYVRIRRMCTNGDPACVPAAYYYCPDGCYEVTPVGESAGGAIPAPGGAATAAAGTAAALGGTVPANPAIPNSGGAGVPAGAGAGRAGAAVTTPDEHPIGPDGEPLTYPGQQP